MKFSLLALIFSTAFLCVYAADEVKDNTTGEVFPSVVTFDSNGKTYTLQATGVATRKKFFVSVYSVASYLQQGAGKTGGDKFQAFMQDENAKQLTLKWVRNVDVKKIQEVYHESFKNALSDSDFSQLQNEINKFIGFFKHDAQKGDVQILRWIPGGDVEVLINNQQVGNINNPQFAKDLWSIWFGERSVVDKNKLVSLIK